MNIQLRIFLVLVELNQLNQARVGWHELMHSQAYPLQRVGSLPEEVRDLADLIGGLLDVSPPWPAEDETAAWRAIHRHDAATARRLYLRALQSARSGVRQARLALALGLLAGAAGDEAEALHRLAQVETQARELNLPEVLWRALQARGQLALAGAGGETTAQPLLITQGGPEVDPLRGLRYTVPEGQGVVAAFDRRSILHDRLATRQAVRPLLPAADVLHVACHATFEPGQPLTARLEMPSGEAWTAAEWLREPLGGLSLVTLSACRSLQDGRLIGDEVFGLVAGFLGGGARAVLGGMWPVVDRPAVDLMWRFYRHLMLADPVSALAAAQREMLSQADTTPLYWAVFALFGDPGGLPAPGWLGRRGARRRQRRHELAFSSQARRISEGTET
jgi:hypothetical protein